MFPVMRSGMGGDGHGSGWSILIIFLLSLACGGVFLWFWRETVRSFE